MTRKEKLKKVRRKSTRNRKIVLNMLQIYTNSCTNPSLSHIFDSITTFFYITCDCPLIPAFLQKAHLLFFMKFATGLKMSVGARFSHTCGLFLRTFVGFVPAASSVKLVK